MKNIDFRNEFRLLLPQKMLGLVLQTYLKHLVELIS